MSLDKSTETDADRTDFKVLRGISSTSVNLLPFSTKYLPDQAVMLKITDFSCSSIR